MKKLTIFIIMILMGSTTLFAQSRKYISQFSHLQQYYNPGLAGYEGSMLRGFVRNQWAGWEGAPMTYFISTELDFGQLSGESDPALLGRNAASLSLFQDSYGAFTETELIVGYASRIRLSETTNLRLGAGINYNTVRLDPSRMTTEQADDPLVTQWGGSFADMQIIDFNIGMALTHEKYYVSYGVHNVNRGGISSGDIFMERKPAVGILQAGFRERVSPGLVFISNAMWRTQSDLPDNVEFNIKLLMKDRIWMGAGHRADYANNFQLGLVFGNMRFGYVYEMPMVKSYLLPNTTHEFMLTYSIFGGGNGMMW